MISGQKVKNSGKTLVTGLFDLTLVAANPNKEQLSAILGTEVTDIKPYAGVENGVAFNNLRIYLKGEFEDDEFIVPITFWLKDEFRKEASSFVVKDDPTSGNKVMLTNNFGLSRYAGPNGEGIGDWFTSPGFRRTKEGEDKLYNFIAAWLNINTKEAGAEIKLDRYEDLLKGDTSEINQIIQEYNDRKIRVLIGVKDGKYMHIFTRAFLSENKVPNDNYNTPVKLSWFTQQVKAVKQDGTVGYGQPWKYDFQNSYEQQFYSPKAGALGEIKGSQAPVDPMSTAPSNDSPFA